jgi:hypothetical protein
MFLHLADQVIVDVPAEREKRGAKNDTYPFGYATGG